MSVTWLAIDLHTNKKGGRSRLGSIQISCEEVVLRWPTTVPATDYDGQLEIGARFPGVLARPVPFPCDEFVYHRRAKSHGRPPNPMGALKRSWAPMAKRASMDGRRNIPN
jgi:hypothetical protein